MKTNKRYWWLIGLINTNGYTVGAEIGCANGATTGRLLRYCKGLKLYAVDKWEKIDAGTEGGAMEGGPGCETWDPVNGLRRFHRATQSHSNRLTVLHGDSTKMAKKVPDGALDFVFIDADHRYPAVIKDLAAWVPKLKPGGTLCGHDIHLLGVKRAVEEKLIQYKEAGIDHVWYCKKEDYVY